MGDAVAPSPEILPDQDVRGNNTVGLPVIPLPQSLNNLKHNIDLGIDDM